jgi:hypothetical protein
MVIRWRVAIPTTLILYIRLRHLGAVSELVIPENFIFVECADTDLVADNVYCSLLYKS